MKTSNFSVNKSSLLSKPESFSGFNWRHHLRRNSSGLLKSVSKNESIPHFRTVYWISSETLSALLSVAKRPSHFDPTFLARARKLERNLDRNVDLHNRDFLLEVVVSSSYIKEVVLLSSTFENLNRYIDLCEGFERVDYSEAQY